jgi:hypothetical protein
MLNSKKGFTSIYCLFTLVLFSMLLMTTSFVRFAFESKTDFRYFCYNDLNLSQQILIDGELKLLQLNPLATSLRMRITLLYASLAAAVASENVPLVIKIQKQIQETKQQQRALDNKQKWIIQMAEQFARAKLELSLALWKKKQILRSHTWNALLGMSESITLNPRFPRLLVTPDSAVDIAPVYRLDPGIETLQIFKANWSIWFFARPNFQRLIKAQQNWSFECVSQPLQNINSLKVQIKADRL